MVEFCEGRSRVVIEGVKPQIDCGAYPIKRVVGDTVVVEADAFVDGHDVISCVALYRKEGAAEWAEAPMEPLVNDRWRGAFKVAEIGRYRYTVMGWVNRFKSWARDLGKRVDAGQEVSIQMRIGADLIAAAAGRAGGDDAARLHAYAEIVRLGGIDGTRLALSPELAALMYRYEERLHATVYSRELAIVVDRLRARFSAWYELFPRSTAAEPGRHGTFADVEARLPYVASMGFDVLYLPPIHPIGWQFRKGRNNTTEAQPGDPGSPWAIGANGGRAQSDPSRAGHAGGFPASGASCAGSRSGDRAGHCLPGIGRPSLPGRTPGVVPQAAGRHDPIRGESAQEVPGHLPVRLRVLGLARAVGRIEERLPVLERTGRPHLPRG